jgi:hypothetical protein
VTVLTFAMVLLSLIATTIQTVMLLSPVTAVITSSFTVHALLAGC